MEQVRYTRLLAATHFASGYETLKVFAYNGETVSSGRSWGDGARLAPDTSMRDTRGETRTVIVDIRGWKEAESGPTLGACV